LNTKNRSSGFEMRACFGSQKRLHLENFEEGFFVVYFSKRLCKQGTWSEKQPLAEPL